MKSARNDKIRAKFSLSKKRKASENAPSEGLKTNTLFGKKTKVKDNKQEVKNSSLSQSQPVKKLATFWNKWASSSTSSSHAAPSLVQAQTGPTSELLNNDVTHLENNTCDMFAISSSNILSSHPKRIINPQVSSKSSGTSNISTLTQQQPTLPSVFNEIKFPLVLFCHVAGTKHHQGRVMIDEKQDVIRQEVVLVREPNNLRDSNAISINTLPVALPNPLPQTECLLGHVPAKVARWLAPLLDNQTILTTAHLLSPSRFTSESSNSHSQSQLSSSSENKMMSSRTASSSSSTSSSCPQQESNFLRASMFPFLSLEICFTLSELTSIDNLNTELKMALHKLSPSLRVALAFLVQQAKDSQKVDIVAKGSHYQLWKHFESMAKASITQDPHLFTSHQIELLKRFIALPIDAKALYCRLMQRKHAGSWVSAVSLLRDDIVTRATLEALTSISNDELNPCHCTFLESTVSSSSSSQALYNTLVPILTIKQVKRVTSKLGAQLPKTNLNSTDLLRYLRRNKNLHGIPLDSCPHVRKIFLQACGEYVRLSSTFHRLTKQICELFFASSQSNETHSPSAFILDELGIQQYHKCKKAIISRPLFPSRSAFISYRCAAKLQMHTDRLLMTKSESQITKTNDLSNAVLTRMLNQEEYRNLCNLGATERQIFLCILEALQRLLLEASISNGSLKLPHQYSLIGNDSTHVESLSNHPLFHSYFLAADLWSDAKCKDQSTEQQSSDLKVEAKPVLLEQNFSWLQNTNVPVATGGWSFRSNDSTGGTTWGWICSQCTFHNAVTSIFALGNTNLTTKCSICQSPRQSNRSLNSQSNVEDEASFLARYQSASVYARICYNGINFLEKIQWYPQACSLLSLLLELDSAWTGSLLSSRRGRMWNRLALNLASHLSDHKRAFAVTRAALQDFEVRSGERVELQNRVLRLWKSKKGGNSKGACPLSSQIKLQNEVADRKVVHVTIRGHPSNRNTGEKSHFFGLDGKMCSVEKLCLQHYAQQSAGSWKGVHCEGSLFRTLFSLLMWDVIFFPVPNVFQHPFQSIPLDWGTNSFYLARREVIENRLAEIASWPRPTGFGRMASDHKSNSDPNIVNMRGHISYALEEIWIKQFGVRCRPMNWDAWTLEVLQFTAEAIGGHALSLICGVLARDFRHWCSGLPDLALWRDPSNTCVFKMVEVKGPRDRLSNQQIAWLRLLSGKVNIEICHVDEHRGLEPTGQ